MDERRLPFLTHLTELRLRLRNAMAALLVGCIVSFWGSKTLYALLARPLNLAWHEVLPGQTANLRFGSLIEPFWVYFELSIYAGLFLASPVIFHQLWRFIAPGLYEKEKKVALPFAAFSGLMFIGGGLFCYFFVFPAMFRFFLSYSTANIGELQGAFSFLGGNVTSGALAVEPALFMQQYLDLTTKMLLGFGLIFELPLAIFFLSYAGLVTHRKLWRFNKYWIILSFIIGGVLTPGPDVLSQFMMAAPLVVLYEASILVSFFVTRRKERAAAINESPSAPSA
jgi:sec-independent protein translocase protein TatC